MPDPLPAGVRPEVGREAPADPMADPANYINRELSWLDFDFRVLAEARDPRVPLLERLRFLAITANNLDEFYMIRVASLLRQVGEPLQATHPDRMTPKEQLAAIRRRSSELAAAQLHCLSREVAPALAKQGVRLVLGEEVNGVPTEHLRAELPGSALAAAVAGALGSLGQAGGATPGAGILSQLVTFGPTTVDGWVATTNHLPQRLTSSSSATLDLGGLSMLAPSGAPAVTGSASMALKMAVGFSRFGADFGLSKPAVILPGLPQLPQSSLSQFA